MPSNELNHQNAGESLGTQGPESGKFPAESTLSEDATNSQLLRDKLIDRAVVYVHSIAGNTYGIDVDLNWKVSKLIYFVVELLGFSKNELCGREVKFNLISARSDSFLDADKTLLMNDVKNHDRLYLSRSQIPDGFNVPLKLADLNGVVHEVQFPILASADELIRRLRAEPLFTDRTDFSLPYLTDDGEPIEYKLFDECTGRMIAGKDCLLDSGVRKGHKLLLLAFVSGLRQNYEMNAWAVGESGCDRPVVHPNNDHTISLKILVENGGEHDIETPNIIVEELLVELSSALNIELKNVEGGKRGAWRLDDMKTGRSLSTDKTLSQNDISDGDQLFLRRIEADST